MLLVLVEDFLDVSLSRFKAMSFLSCVDGRTSTFYNSVPYGTPLRNMHQLNVSYHSQSEDLGSGQD